MGLDSPDKDSFISQYKYEQKREKVDSVAPEKNQYDKLKELKERQVQFYKLEPRNHEIPKQN